MSSGAVADQDHRIVGRPVRQQRLRRNVLSLAPRHHGALGPGGDSVRGVTVVKISALDLGEDLTGPVIEGADRSAFDLVRGEARAFELRERVSPIREWQL